MGETKATLKGGFFVSCGCCRYGFEPQKRVLGKKIVFPFPECRKFFMIFFRTQEGISTIQIPSQSAGGSINEIEFME